VEMIHEAWQVCRTTQGQPVDGLAIRTRDSRESAPFVDGQGIGTIEIVTAGCREGKNGEKGRKNFHHCSSLPLRRRAFSVSSLFRLGKRKVVGKERQNFQLEALFHAIRMVAFIRLESTQYTEV